MGALESTGAREQGLLGAVLQRRYSRVPRGTQETVFLLETFSDGAGGPDGPNNPLWVRPISGREGNQTCRHGDMDLSLASGSECDINFRRRRISLLSNLGSPATGLARLNHNFGGWIWVWILDLFASVHCVISRPVLARWAKHDDRIPGDRPRNARERLHRTTRTPYTHAGHASPGARGSRRSRRAADGLTGRVPSRKGNIGL